MTVLRIILKVPPEGEREEEATEAKKKRG